MFFTYFWIRGKSLSNLFVDIIKNKKALTGITILIFIFITAIFAPVIAPHSPSKQELSKRLKAPYLLGGEITHLLGTDAIGRDILSRIIYGSRISLIVALASVIGAGLIGSILGILCGYFGGKLDNIIMRIVDVQMAIPFLVLAIFIMAILQPGLKNVIIVLVVAGWGPLCSDCKGSDPSCQRTRIHCGIGRFRFNKTQNYHFGYCPQCCRTHFYSCNS